MEKKQMSFLKDHSMHDGEQEKNRTIIKGDPIEIECTTEEVNWLSYVTAKDTLDGDITQFVKVNDSFVKKEKEGQYLLVYEVTNSRNQTTYKSILVTVKNNADTEGKTTNTIINEITIPNLEHSSNKNAILPRMEGRKTLLLKDKHSVELENEAVRNGGDGEKGTGFSAEEEKTNYEEFFLPAACSKSFIERLIVSGIQITPGKLIKLDRDYINKQQINLGKRGLYWIPYHWSTEEEPPKIQRNIPRLASF